MALAALILAVAAVVRELKVQSKASDLEDARLAALVADLYAFLDEPEAAAPETDAEGAPAATAGVGGDDDMAGVGGAGRHNPHIPPAANRAFAMLADCMHALPGFFHLGNLGLLTCMWKLYFAILIAPLLVHCWKNRSRVTAKCNFDYTRCSEAFYHAQRAIWLGMIHEFESWRDSQPSLGEAAGTP